MTHEILFSVSFYYAAYYLTIFSSELEMTKNENPRSRAVIQRIQNPYYVESKTKGIDNQFDMMKEVQNSSKPG